jgi:RNA polymerase sigma-70 factor (ECF subfamily)
MCQFNRDIERLLPRLRQYAWVLTRDRNGADDLLQASIAHALEKRSYWAEGTDLRAWLFTIMHNLFVTDRRRVANSPVAVVADVGQWEVGCRSSQDERLAVRDLERALGQLPHDQRTIVLLAAMQGLSYKQIGDALDLPMGTVKSKLFRARETLRNLIDGAAGPTVLANAA